MNYCANQSALHKWTLAADNRNVASGPSWQQFVLRNPRNLAYDSLNEQLFATTLALRAECVRRLPAVVPLI
jgi:hypothetical protein